MQPSVAKIPAAAYLPKLDTSVSKGAECMREARPSAVICNTLAASHGRDRFDFEPPYDGQNKTYLQHWGNTALQALADIDMPGPA